jgi:hypothetical protein
MRWVERVTGHGKPRNTCRILGVKPHACWRFIRWSLNDSRHLLRFLTSNDKERRSCMVGHRDLEGNDILEFLWSDWENHETPRWTYCYNLTAVAHEPLMLQWIRSWRALSKWAFCVIVWTELDWRCRCWRVRRARDSVERSTTQHQAFFLN